MARFLSDVLDILRLAVGRRNKNDEDSTDILLTKYVNNFVSLSMSDDLRIFQNFDTLEFSIDESNPSAVYKFKDVFSGKAFSTISTEGFITIAQPPGNEYSWNSLKVCFDPGIFFNKWGVNNDEVIVKGYPTEMLFYGGDFTFRTIPDKEYKVTLYGYTIYPDFASEGDPEIPEDYLLRYIAYGSALQYASDYRYEESDYTRLLHTFKREKSLVLTRMHNQIKLTREKPSF